MRCALRCWGRTLRPAPWPDVRLMPAPLLPPSSSIPQFTLQYAHCNAHCTPCSVGMLFIPNDDALEAQCRAVFERVAAAENFKVHYCRQLRLQIAGITVQCSSVMFCVLLLRCTLQRTA